MENPVHTDVVERSELDGLETVPDINKKKITGSYPALHNKEYASKENWN